jgi:hypothetical protein
MSCKPYSSGFAAITASYRQRLHGSSITRSKTANIAAESPCGASSSHHVMFAISSFGTAPMTPEEFVEAPLGKLENCALMLSCYEGCKRLGSCSMQLMAAKVGRQTQLRTVIR